MERYRPLLDPQHPEAAAPLDDRSLAEFTTLYFGRSALSHWLEPWLAGRAPESPERTSRVAFLLAWRRQALGAIRVAARPVRDSLTAVLPRSAVWTARVKRLVPSPPGAYEILGTRAGEPVRLRPDAVVLALPARAAARLAPECLHPTERDALKGWKSDPSATWVVRVERVPPAWDRALAHAGGVLVRIPKAASTSLSALSVRRYADELWVAVRLRPAAAIAAIGPAVDFQRLAAFARAELARCLPGLRVSAARDHWQVEPFAFPRFEVGVYRRLARLRRVAEAERRRGRRIYLAGDYWMEATLDGAARSGLRAAGELLADRGR